MKYVKDGMGRIKHYYLDDSGFGLNYLSYVEENDRYYYLDDSFYNSERQVKRRISKKEYMELLAEAKTLCRWEPHEPQ